MRHTGTSAAAILAAAVMLGGCANQAAPGSIPDGLTPISKNMTGYWKAPGGEKCRWWVSDKAKGGTIGDNGNTEGPSTGRRQQNGRAADQSQAVIIGTGDVGLFLHSDRCGGWKR